MKTQRYTQHIAAIVSTDASAAGTRRVMQKITKITTTCANYWEKWVIGRANAKQRIRGGKSADTVTCNGILGI